VIKQRIIFFISAVFLLVCFSCGIEVIYSLDPPSLIQMANPEDTANRYFWFRTNETSSNNNRPVFKGTAVYYRLYNTLSFLNSDIGSISSANTEFSSGGFNRLTSLGYQALDATSHPDILYADSGSDKAVRIRLFDELPSFPKETVPNIGIPLRSNNKEFNFYIDPNPDLCSDLPVSGDADTYFSTSPDAPEKWYVAAFAVSIGQDTYLAPLYSQVLYLGYITIAR
jgi:hypothetical protein